MNTNAPALFREPREILRGTVHQIVYTNVETSYTVLRLALEEDDSTVTVVGKFLDVQPGENLQLQGQWSQNPRYGRQFRCAHYVRSQPSTLKGIERYLGGMIRGIGPHLAKQMVRYFGFDTLRVIEEDPERLSEVRGIGKSRVAQIREAWQEYKAQQEVMVFLQGYGISLNQSIKIFREYGYETIGLLRENPYRLATDIRGIGFRSADQIAQSLGLPPDSPFRAEAAVLYHLQKMSDQGHIFYPRSALVAELNEILNLPIELLQEAVNTLDQRGDILLEALEEDQAIFRRVLAACERGAANQVRRVLAQPPTQLGLDFAQVLERFERESKLTLAPAQRQAIAMGVHSPLSIITGGPGTGKTTIVRAICALKKKARILLAAPTGRAAKRLSETTGAPASTLHRLLDFSPHAHKFQRNESKPLRADLIIVDEASMIDIFLFFALMRAVPEGAQLILVGDVDQLPSVGPGNVLRDLIASGIIPFTRLEQIFRQEEGGLIVENAHRINIGELPVLPKPAGQQLLDFYFVPRNNPMQAAQSIVELVTSRIPKRFGFDPLKDVQVISPMYRAEIGVESLNQMLQEKLGAQGAALTVGGKKFLRNDRVIQTRNDYDKDVFNGDVGTIEEIDTQAVKLIVRFEDRLIPYERTELDDLSLAYAISVHKSQGSEYPAVVVPVMPQHYMMLQRNLLYTAITRGKQLVVLVGTRKALNIAVKNDAIKQRFSRLSWRLQELRLL